MKIKIPPVLLMLLIAIMMYLLAPLVPAITSYQYITIYLSLAVLVVGLCLYQPKRTRGKFPCQLKAADEIVACCYTFSIIDT